MYVNFVEQFAVKLRGEYKTDSDSTNEIIWSEMLNNHKLVSRLICYYSAFSIVNVWGLGSQG